MKKCVFGLVLSLLIFTASCNINNFSAEEEEIKSLLETQRNDWNRGDLKAYMLGYWESDSLMFIGKNGITYGWRQTLDNYAKSYPTAEAMGQLNFTIIKVEVTTKESAFVVGKWMLLRENQGNVSGHFTLFVRKIAGQWKVVADHSS